MSLLPRINGKIRKPTAGRSFSSEVTSGWIAANGANPLVAFDPSNDPDLADEINLALSETGFRNAIRDHNASGSIATTTGSISSGSPNLTLASAIDFKNGQGIYIAGAGASGANLITSIVSGAGTPNLVLAVNAGATVSGAVVQHDDQDALQAMFTALLSSGGGTGYIPKGYYRCNKGFSSTTRSLIGSGVYNTQSNTVKFLGDSSGGWPYDKVSRGGTTIATALTSVPDSTFLYAILGTVEPPEASPNNVHRFTWYAEGIHFETPQNPPFSAVNFQYLEGGVCRDVTAGPAVGILSVAFNTGGTKASGIRLPTFNNRGLATCDNTFVWGFDNGYWFAEHANFLNVMASRCRSGAFTESGGHLSTGVLDIFQCVNALEATAGTWSNGFPHALHFIISTEHTGTGSFAPGADIVDPNNQLTGIVFYEITGPSGTQPPLVKTGGANIGTTNLFSPVNLSGFSQSQIEEFARDALGAALVAGTGITISPNDGADTITIAGTGGGGGSGGVSYSVRLKTDLSLASSPTSDTVISGMSITVPASATARTVAVSFNVGYTGTHGMRAKVFLDGSVEYPDGGFLDGIVGVPTDAASTGSGDLYYTIGGAGIIVDIPGDSATHTVEVRWNSIASTTAIVVRDRTMLVAVL